MIRPQGPRFPFTISVRLSEPAAAALLRQAAAEDRPPASLARRLLTDALAQGTEARASGEGVA